MAGRRKEHPEGWPGTGEAPSYGDGHVAPYAAETARWIRLAERWVDREVSDSRRNRTCKDILLQLILHTEHADSLPEGRPFACVSANTLATELGLRKQTVIDNLSVLTSDSAPLRIVWKPKGRGRGSCYEFKADFRQ